MLLGVVLGLAVRTGVAVHLPLPEMFCQQLAAGSENLSNGESQSTAMASFARSKRNLVKVSALTMRLGILSMVPEVRHYVRLLLMVFDRNCAHVIQAVWELLHLDDIHQLLGHKAHRLSALQLRHRALYLHRIDNVFRHQPPDCDSQCVAYLWAALGELSAKQLKQFVGTVVSSSENYEGTRGKERTFSADAFSTTSDICLHISVCDTNTVSDGQDRQQQDSMPLTVVSVDESAGNCSDRHADVSEKLTLGLQLPRYSSLKVAFQHVLAFIALPNST